MLVWCFLTPENKSSTAVVILWYTHAQVPPGCNWRVWWCTKAEKCKVVVPILSPPFFESPACAAELTFAGNHCTTLVAVQAEPYGRIPLDMVVGHIVKFTASVPFYYLFITFRLPFTHLLRRPLTTFWLPSDYLLLTFLCNLRLPLTTFLSTFRVPPLRTFAYLWLHFDYLLLIPLTAFDYLWILLNSFWQPFAYSFDDPWLP